MTKDTFVRTIQTILTAGGEIHMNSVHESFLNHLGRLFERGEVTSEEVLNQLKNHFSYLLNRDLERQISKTLR